MHESERLAVIENELENLKGQLARFRSTLESEDGTLLRLVKYITDDVAILKKESADMKIQVALIEERMNSNKWWVRIMIVTTLPLVVKIIFDIIQN